MAELRVIWCSCYLEIVRLAPAGRQAESLSRLAALPQRSIVKGRCLDTTHWAKLAEEFRRLSPSIRANRLRNHPGIIPCWNLGGALSTDLEDFRRLAAIAASFHGSASTTADDEVEAWLNLLATNHTKCFEDDTPRAEVSIFPPWVRKENINHVSSASADYCERLAAQARIAVLEENRKAVSTPELQRIQGIEVAADPRPPTSAAKGLFLRRALWLAERLHERSWNKHDVERNNGPHHKTVQKILNGEHVREDVLKKLADALSGAPVSLKLPRVNLTDIPTE